GGRVRGGGRGRRLGGGLPGRGRVVARVRVLRCLRLVLVPRRAAGGTVAHESPRSVPVDHARAGSPPGCGRRVSVAHFVAREDNPGGIRPVPLEETPGSAQRSEEHTSELQSRENLVCRLLLEKKKNREP